MTTIMSDADRAAFEAWAISEDGGFVRKALQRYNGSYVYQGAQDAWNGWQAALAYARSDGAAQQSAGVRVCPELDRECGDFERSWCATCPKRKVSTPPQSNGLTDAVEVFKEIVTAYDEAIAELNVLGMEVSEDAWKLIEKARTIIAALQPTAEPGKEGK